MSFVFFRLSAGGAKRNHLHSDAHRSGTTVFAKAWRRCPRDNLGRCFMCL
jgi:hypothetical protein